MTQTKLTAAQQVILNHIIEYDPALEKGQIGKSKGGDIMLGDLIQTALAGESNAAIIGQQLSGYVSATGVISPSDTILSAIEKLNGNDAGGSGLPLLSQTVTLTAAQINAMWFDGSFAQNPVAVVAGVPGKIMVPKIVMAKYNYVAAFTIIDPASSLLLFNSSDLFNPISSFITDTGFLDQVVNKTAVSTSLNNTWYDGAIGQGISIGNRDGLANPSTSGGVGSTVDVTLYYYLV